MKVCIVNGFESVNATDMDHHIQYESVTPGSFYTSYCGIICHILHILNSFTE
jgi:hypothetical protein